VSTQLQTGTTPGNPRLVRRINVAEQKLEELSQSIASLNQLNNQSAEFASRVAYLLEQARAAYSLSGAVEEDHVRLAVLEDELNATAVSADRVIRNISDDIARTVSYVSSERSNLRTLSLAVTNGDLYGRRLQANAYGSADNGASFTNVSAKAEPVTQTSLNGAASANTGSQEQLQGGKILAKIRFDRSDVDYEQPVYTAVSEALRRYPEARFEITAINPTRGNAAEVAIETTRARRNAEKVLRTLSEMGLSADRVVLSARPSDQAQSSEVHIYMR
jgi:hypothetical protein